MMHWHTLFSALALSSSIWTAISSPAPAPTEIALAPTRVKRNLGDTVLSLLDGLPSEVASGVPTYFENLPVGSNSQKSLGISNDDLAAIPTSVLNFPSYGNFTPDGWNLRFRGNVYKLPNISSQTVDKLTNGFLPDVKVTDLPADQAAQARNVTKSIYVVQQSKANVSILLTPGTAAERNKSVNGIGAGGITLPYPTTEEGDYDVFLPINSSSFQGLTPGNNTTKVQVLDAHTNGTDSGNATMYLVPDTGITVISDIDDILRITKIYKPKEGLLNSFARPYVPWMNMPEIYQDWFNTIPNIHFHYLTTLPEQVTRTYVEFIYRTYPLGSFDTRPLNFSDVSETLKVRKFLLNKIFDTFPKRKFVLVADTSNSDVMSGYPQMAKDYPGQVSCILLRNTSATDSDDKFPYDTSGFKDIDPKSYMFFVTPDDLKNIDITNGNCLNTSVVQNVTFGEQGLPLGINLGSGKTGAAAAVQRPLAQTLLVGVASALLLLWLL